MRKSKKEEKWSLFNDARAQATKEEISKYFLATIFLVKEGEIFLSSLLARVVKKKVCEKEKKLKFLKKSFNQHSNWSKCVDSNDQQVQ